MSNNSRRLIPLLLLLGDLIALLLFIIVGQREHELADAANPIRGVLLTAGEFGLPWLAAAWLLGAFPRALGDGEGDHTGGDRTEGDHKRGDHRGGDHKGRPYRAVGGFLTRSLNTWLVAAPLGVVLRAFVLGRAVIPTTFIVATLGFGGLFLLGWRLVFALAWTWLRRER